MKKLTLEEFEAFLKEKGCIETLSYPDGRYGRPSAKCAFSKRWTIGGIQGGSCWGGEPDEPVQADDEPEFSGLEEFFEDVFPSLTFLQYKILLKKAHSTEYRESCYYGNYEDCALKYITVEDLYDFFVQYIFEE